MRRPFIVAATLVAAALATPTAFAQDKQPSARGTGGAAATVDALGTAAAIEILRAGGNAVDAAVAAAAVLGVTEPYSCGIGGGGFMVLRDDRRDEISTIDSREKSPAAMQPNSFFINGRPPAGSADFAVNRYSGLSAGVPGTVAGWERALRRHGTMSFREVLRPAIRVAERGFRVDQTFVDQTLPNVPYFDDVPSTAALYLDPDGTPRDVGATIRNPHLGRVYRRIARLGAKGFYSGPIARAIARASVNPPIAPTADHTWRPGLMTERDIERYRARTREPTVSDYRGLDVYGMGPPSSGGVAVGEALNILEGFSPLGSSRIEATHRYLEASRLAFADRNAFLADPAFFRVPLRGLLSDEFAAERRALIGPNAAQSPVAPGDPSQENGSAQATATITHPGQSTTHLSVADRRGNVVSYTFTIESTGGNGIVVPGYGFLLNNELTDFDYGSVTHPNRAEGNKRPRSSMAPTIVMKGRHPFLAVGSPGGATIITTVLQTLVNRIDFREPLPRAIALPRASQRNSARTEAEVAFQQAPEGQALRALGHQYSTPSGAGEIGAATGVEIRRGGRFVAAAEPTRRGGGAAAVVRPQRR